MGPHQTSARDMFRMMTLIRQILANHAPSVRGQAALSMTRTRMQSELARPTHSRRGNAAGRTLCRAPCQSGRDKPDRKAVPEAHGKAEQGMNLTIEQNWHGKRDGKNTDFSAGLRGASLMSNLFGPTFFSRTPGKACEKPERSAFVCGIEGKML